jgi:hypothetical protein
MRERSFATVGIIALSRTAGEGAERSEAGEGTLRYSAAWGAAG